MGRRSKGSGREREGGWGGEVKGVGERERGWGEVKGVGERGGWGGEVKGVGERGGGEK